MRKNTERPVTLECGSNVLVGIDTIKFVETYKKIMKEGLNNLVMPPLWEGKAAERIVDILLKEV